jgi:hypothetical protein
MIRAIHKRRSLCGSQRGNDGVGGGKARRTLASSLYVSTSPSYHPSWTEQPFAAPADQIAISIQALHHLTAEQMQAAYFTLYDILEPHGLFLLLDRTAVTTPERWSAYKSLWRLLNVQEGETYEEHIATGFDRRSINRAY